MATLRDSVKLLARVLMVPTLMFLAVFGIKAWEYFEFMLFYWNILLFIRFYDMKCRSERRKAGSPSDKLKILLVGDAFPPKVDGVATFATHTINEMQRRGHQVHILTSVTETPTLFGAKVTRLPGIRMEYCPEHSISIPMPYTCLALLLREKPDVVHLFEYGWLTPFMAFYCWLADIPCCWSHHTRIDLYIDLVKFPWFVPKWFQHSLYRTTDPLFSRCADGHLAVCKNLYEKYKIRFGYENVRLWKTGVSDKFHPSRYNLETKRKLTEGRPELPLILHVGRISPDKQSEELFPVLSALYDAMDGQVRFAIIGDGHIRKDIQQNFVDAGIPCVFTGFMTGDPLVESFASADVFFSPSALETYPIVFLEAMRSGLAVVGPRNTGTADTFEDDVHGCYYNNKAPNMVEDAVRAIRRALANKERYAKRGVEHVKQLTWEAVNDEFENMMYSLANKRLSGTGGKLESTKLK